jgi:chemotaxis family two-component system sensor kinase Cph1
MSGGPNFGMADLTNCDREPIHIPGSIQPHGALLVLDGVTFSVVQAGGSTQACLGIEPSALAGRSANDLLSAGEMARLGELVASDDSKVRPILAFTRSDRKDSGIIDVTFHVSDGYVILEFEPVVEHDHRDTLVQVQAMVREVQEAESVNSCCERIAAVVRSVTGFDRVMVYRFLDDGSGAVEAEARDPVLPPYLGLRYPASDIPKQARELYVRSSIRLIADVLAEPAPLEPPLETQLGRPLDLSYAALRAVSPIHIEYLRNMNVAATMSISLVLRGELWGLIACHAQTRRQIAHRLRTALELFGQMASFRLETAIAAEELKARARPDAVATQLVNELTGEAAPNLTLRKLRLKLLEMIEADGVGLWLDNEFTKIGLTPDAAQVAELVKWLNKTPGSGVFHTNSLPLVYPPAVDFAAVASGIIALSVSKVPRDYVIWFRREVIQTVTWAGNPDKAVQSEPDNVRLSPRKSFEAWRQQVIHQSAPWSSIAIQSAEKLRAVLLDVVLRHIDQLAREREAARERQETLLAALDERIRQWELTARELKIESDRRTIVEEELSQVLRSTVVSQEAERLRIARELHDTLGQYLSILQLSLDGLEHQVAATPELSRRVTQLKSLTANVGQEVSRLAWEIRPTSLDDLGLQPAMQQFLEEWSETAGLQVDHHLTLGDRRLPTIVETTLYRILQEAMTNIVKHAKATRVGVILKADAGMATLIVEDDGRGFQLEEVGANGTAAPRLGLLGMRERLALVEGALEIETVPGRGTTIIIHVPIG